ncbi:hypothetical protein UFOVP1413_3 [uncultured Caudovirales phage]|uniref:Glycine-rich domain-containing protein n=1 Tax=uncultured Caudovirales phage TaxID=2100421 RepID=A0A6J5PC54_9CAUD|nr:hypothetical protein UFOVP893_36 [uncultured Caudovirales phage]CAB4210269.1 hypothetical protein UFOVP1413_3 [uncultured Caudovirales phage]
MTTANKGLAQPTYNSETNTWGTTSLNNNFGYLDQALGGSTLLNATGLGNTTVTLSQTQCRPATLAISGTPGGIVTYEVAAGIGGQWVVRNGVSGGYAIRLQSASGGTYVSVSAGDNLEASCDGSASGMVRNTTAVANAAGSTTQVQFNSSGAMAGSANLTFDGTTLAVAGLTNSGDTVLGDAGGDTLTINSNAMAIPNTLNVGSNTLYLSPSGTQVGIGTTTVGSNMLTVAGTVASTAGGFVFPDSTTQTTAATATGGNVVILTFTASGVYTPNANMVTCIIECVAGGGGGGGLTGDVGWISESAGGGSGGYARKLATAVDIGASKTVTIGAGGAGGTAGNTDGTAGSDTSVGALCIAKGGSGGQYTDAGVQIGVGGLGGVSGTGALAPTGTPGGSGYVLNSTAGTARGAAGGSSYFGGGAGQAVRSATGVTTGLTATAYGGGGGGAASLDTASTAAGGAGFAGVVIITEYRSQ